jgi:hypothetical protein
MIDLYCKIEQEIIPEEFVEEVEIEIDEEA